MVRQYAQRQQRQRSVQQYQQGSVCFVLQQQQGSQLVQLYSLLLRVQRRLASQARAATTGSKDCEKPLINQLNPKGLQLRKPFVFIIYKLILYLFCKTVIFISKII